MKFVVIGGSGLIGTGLVANLRQRGHEVVSASPSSGVDTITGRGLEQALAGAQVLVDVSNSPSFEDQAVLEFFRTSTRNLLAAAQTAGVRHFLALSVVGTEKLQQMGYFRAKLVQEDLIKASPVPFTIVRATQFYEFIGGIADAGTSGQTTRVSSALFQPMAAQDVSKLLATLALREPNRATVEIAGPAKVRMDAVVSRFLQVTGDRRTVVAAADAPYFGAPISDDSLVAAPDAMKGDTPFESWLEARTTAAA
jgi:uncharacterized protein YbjT (DUF2867 family)